MIVVVFGLAERDAGVGTMRCSTDGRVTASKCTGGGFGTSVTTRAAYSPPSRKHSALTAVDFFEEGFWQGLIYLAFAASHALHYITRSSSLSQHSLSQFSYPKSAL